jgi:hypothetical protein
MEKENTTKKRPGDRVIEAIAKAAGDVLSKSKLPVSERIRISGSMTALGTTFAELAAEAWAE